MNQYTLLGSILTVTLLLVTLKALTGTEDRRDVWLPGACSGLSAALTFLTLWLPNPVT